jgi:membrane-associated protein
MDNVNMDIISNYLDLIFHVDQVLQSWVQTNADLTYGLFFLIIFIETGLVFMPFLPGDSLLFMIGALCSAELLSPTLSLWVCLSAAILGDQVNYTIGRHFGKHLLRPPFSKWIKQEGLARSEVFFAQWGALAIILARFMPFIRTFAPFVAGISKMNRLTFTSFNALGALIWVVGVGLLGYTLGEIPWVKSHVQALVLALIIVPGLLAIWGTLKSQTPKKTSRH